jgi:hypothetical protein
MVLIYHRNLINIFITSHDIHIPMQREHTNPICPLATCPSALAAPKQRSVKRHGVVYQVVSCGQLAEKRLSEHHALCARRDFSAPKQRSVGCLGSDGKRRLQVCQVRNQQGWQPKSKPRAAAPTDTSPSLLPCTSHEWRAYSLQAAGVHPLTQKVIA